MSRSSGWSREVTETFSTQGTSCRAGDYITIYRHDITSGTSTGPTLYRVTSSNNEVYEATLIDAQQIFNETDWTPGKWEINRKAAIKGARAQEEKHKRAPKTALRARSSFQQMYRLPCYRGTRSR